MSTQLIGHVGVDSGQLLLCDPCYIDSEWVNEDFEDIRVYRHKITGDTLQYRVEFPHYEAIVPEYGKTMNQLIDTGEWEEEKDYHAPKAPFSYNACAKATLSEDGYGELNFKLGHSGAGVAFRTAFGDGIYPVVAHYHRDGTLRSVEVLFQNDEEEEEDEEEYDSHD
jgi:hypothetical protein